MVERISREPAALPFVDLNPISPRTPAAMAKGVAEALRMVVERGALPEIVVQVGDGSRQPLPIHLKKWPAAAYLLLPGEAVLVRPDESIDVLVTQFRLREQANARSFSVGGWVQKIHSLLAPGGVWYFHDLLPVEMPAHWVYQFFPGSWDQAKRRSVDTHTFHRELQQAGFTLRLKRHHFFEPVRFETAMEIAAQRPGVLSRLRDEEVEAGLARMRARREEAGGSKPLSSEIVILEGWAQKDGPDG